MGKERIGSSCLQCLSSILLLYYILHSVKTLHRTVRKVFFFKVGETGIGKQGIFHTGGGDRFLQLIHKLCHDMAVDMFLFLGC